MTGSPGVTSAAEGQPVGPSHLLGDGQRPGYAAARGSPGPGQAVRATRTVASPSMVVQAIILVDGANHRGVSGPSVGRAGSGRTSHCEDGIADSVDDGVEIADT